MITNPAEASPAGIVTVAGTVTFVGSLAETETFNAVERSPVRVIVPPIGDPLIVDAALRPSVRPGAVVSVTTTFVVRAPLEDRAPALGVGAVGADRHGHVAVGGRVADRRDREGRRGLVGGDDDRGRDSRLVRVAAEQLDRQRLVRDDVAADGPERRHWRPAILPNEAGAITSERFGILSGLTVIIADDAG